MKGPVIRWIALIVVLAETAGIVAFFELPRVLSQVNSETAISSYQTAKVQKGDLTASIGVNGLVRSKQSAILNWQTTGIVGLVNVARGQQVSADDVLAELKQSSLSQVIIFKDQTEEAVKKRPIFGGLRSYSDTTIEVKRLFTNYPERVIIRQWKNLTIDHKSG